MIISVPSKWTYNLLPICEQSYTNDKSKSSNALILHVREKMQFLHFSISPGSAQAFIKTFSATSLQKNYENRLMCTDVIVCNISIVSGYGVL